MKQSNSRPSAAERARIRRLKAAYRKRMLIVGVIFFILGIVAGALVHSWYVGRRDAPVQALEPTPFPEQANPFGTDLDDVDAGLENGGFAVEEEPAAEPEPEPEPEAEPEPTDEPEPEVTEVPKPIIQIPVTPEPESAEAGQPVIQVPGAAEEDAFDEDDVFSDGEEGDEEDVDMEDADAEDADEEEIDALASIDDEEEPGAEPVGPAEASVPAPDMASDDVPEYDPSLGEVPVEYTMDQEQLANPEQAAAAETAAEPAAAQAAEPSDGPQVIAVVPYGESYSYTTQVNMDGGARVEADGAPYETLHFTQTMKEYMRPSDFANRYATEYRLQGDEAGAGFELVLNNYEGTSVIIPQNVIDVGFCSATGNTVERGYQLMDKAIGGNYNVVVEPETPKTLFKRYAYSTLTEEMEYLVITTYNDGRQEMILFELESDEPVVQAIVYPTMQKGLKSDDEKNMQERLIELEYLKGKADGDFGPATEKAVKAAQEDFGMEPNGVADNEFQQKLYEGMESKPVPVGQGDSAAETSGN